MNFIYFNPDELRADVVGCYGHPLVQTPNIDQFASSGVRFDQCHVQHTVCSPSRCSFMTGWYPHTRGHRSLWHLLQPDEPNTLKYLKSAGYEVHWMGKNDLLAAESFADSVTEIHRLSAAGGDANRLSARGEPGYWDFLYGPRDGHAACYHRVNDAIEFLKTRAPGGPPFMLNLTLSLPHPAYTVPPRWYDMYAPADVPDLLPPGGTVRPAYHEAIRRTRQLDKLSDARFRKIMAVYLGMVSYLDHIFGRFLDALDETGLADDTVVIFFSDHGDWAGDYGLVEKWPSALDDKLTRVPMILRSPGCAAGHVVSEPVECFDIMPTTLELAGVAVGHDHDARAMVPQLHGAPGDPDRAVFAEGGYDVRDRVCFEDSPGHVGHKGYSERTINANPDGIYYPKGQLQADAPRTVCRSTMIRSATHKLVRRPNDVDELFDLTTDPGEMHNVYGQPEYAAIQADLSDRMLNWYIGTADVSPFDRDARGTPKP